MSRNKLSDSVCRRLDMAAKSYVQQQPFATLSATTVLCIEIISQHIPGLKFDFGKFYFGGK